MRAIRQYPWAGPACLTNLFWSFIRKLISGGRVIAIHFFRNCIGSAPVISQYSRSRANFFKVDMAMTGRLKKAILPVLILCIIPLI